jgi:hypothetical protein
MTGRKLSYCMEDSYPHLKGPTIPCEAGSTCESQGISAGWADSYPNTLGCQWLVLRGTTAAPTDIPAGTWYLHETCTNSGRAFHEGSFDNNCGARSRCLLFNREQCKGRLQQTDFNGECCKRSLYASYDNNQRAEHRKSFCSEIISIIAD